ncbi:MAG TPA: hypothetical protein VFN22_13295 [Gemmatimonadales bacterium]|nr:hypothetical protein [Gemmatimonadales bacterium]
MRHADDEPMIRAAVAHRLYGHITLLEPVTSVVALHDCLRAAGDFAFS